MVKKEGRLYLERAEGNTGGEGERTDKENWEEWKSHNQEI